MFIFTVFLEEAVNTTCLDRLGIYVFFMTKFMISGPLRPGRVQVSESSFRNISKTHIKHVLLREHVYDCLNDLFFNEKHMFFDLFMNSKG